MAPAGVSISPEDARRFAVDLLENYFSGPDAYFPDGSKKPPYSPNLDALNGIYDPDPPRKKNTLVEKLYDLQSRLVDQAQRAYVQSLIGGMIDFREKFGERLEYENEVRPFLNSPVFPDYQGRFPKLQPRMLRPIP
ncbi:hypothetical protein ABID19_000657 [Mesorhizobium robiniae]|uniref:Uncharacterized protein n=1 Tax=Mesorhizobium robiniae TaxID=559315 RepID=A0ABV2GHZ4_9HYPH